MRKKIVKCILKYGDVAYLLSLAFFICANITYLLGLTEASYVFVAISTAVVITWTAAMLALIFNRDKWKE